MKLTWIGLCLGLVAVVGVSGRYAARAADDPPQAKGKPLLFDGFEYVVARDNDPLPGWTNNPFVTAGPWAGVKATNITGKGKGRLYTTDTIPGYSGAMPGTGSRRVLKMEAQNVRDGTDFYLQYGTEASPDNTVPANVWFQWWMYINHHATGPYGPELSGVEKRHKFIYPAIKGYPGYDGKWLLSLGANPEYPLLAKHRFPFGNPSAGGQAFPVLRDVAGPRYALVSPWDDNKIGPNLQPVEKAYIVPNQWQLIKVNIDTSVADRGTFQVWIKPLGGPWRKITEWIGGVTADFTWIVKNGAGGHRMFRMPTTIGWSDTEVGGAHYYVDDFAMAGSEEALPKYPVSDKGGRR